MTYQQIICISSQKYVSKKTPEKLLKQINTKILSVYKFIEKLFDYKMLNFYYISFPVPV